MLKRFFSITLLLLGVCTPVFSVVTINSINTDNEENCVDFSKMTRLWCTVDYKHWEISYTDMIDYDEVDFYLYLDEPHKKIYNENKEEVAEILSFEDKEIKFVNKYHQNKRTYVENYTLDIYTGRAKGEGTIRHDYGAWASLTYENRDFNAKGQCATMSEERKF